MLNMAFEAFFLTIKRRAYVIRLSMSGDTPRLLHNSRPYVHRAVTLPFALTHYFRFGFSPVDNICFRLELVFFKHS